MAKAKDGEGKMKKFSLREFVQGGCMIGIFFGFLFLDSNPLLGAVISIVCIVIFFLMEKGIL